MNVVYSSSDLFSEMAGISILSLLENNTNVDKINIYVIDNGITEKNKTNLRSISDSFGRDLFFVQPLDIEKLSDTQINVGRWNISTFYRLFLPTILPDTVDKVLFIDCDTIVLQDLSPLWDMDMAEKWLYGVDDCRGAAYRTNIGLKPEDNYINNGVLLMDLKAWRENDVEKQFLQFIHDNQGDITYVDQGVQNGVLSKQNKTGLLHPKYNCLTIFFAFDYENLIKLRRPPIPGDPALYKEAIDAPVIVHFQSCFKMSIRPWVRGCKHPYTSVFLEYKAKSPWKDAPLHKDDRTVPQKMLSAIACILPEKMMVNVISFLHTRVYPTVRNVKQKVNLRNN